MSHGHGLPDCYDPPIGGAPEQQSLYSYGKLYLDKNRHSIGNYIPLTYGGQSNNEIIYKLVSTDIQEGDIVVVQWTFFTRDVFFDKPLPRRAGEFDNEYMEYLTKLSSNQDLAIKNLMNIYTCLKYLESKKANIIMWFVEGFEQKDFQGGYESFYNKLFSEIDKYNFTGELWNPIFTTDDIQDTSKSSKQPDYLDFGLDNLHPGVKTHEKMSYLLENIINTKFLQ